MSNVQIPDLQHIEMDALDKAFFEWLAGNDQFNNDAEEYEARVNVWHDCSPSEPLSWSGEEWGDMHEDDRESAMWAMEKDMGEEISKKRRILQNINDTGDVWPRRF